MLNLLTRPLAEDVSEYTRSSDFLGVCVIDMSGEKGIDSVMVLVFLASQ